jgi:hypothetical protein
MYLMCKYIRLFFKYLKLFNNKILEFDAIAESRKPLK